MYNNQSRVFALFPYAVILIGWFIFIYPSLFNTYWFFLDAPSIIQTSKNMFTNLGWLIPSDGSGRYFPFFWLYHGILFQIFGENPFGYYLIQSLIVLSTALLMYWIIKSITESFIYGVIATFIFLSSSPVPENVYTLGKSEFLILPLILLVVMLFIKSLRESGGLNYYYLVACMLLSATAVWIKETAMVVGVFGISCLVTHFILTVIVRVRIKNKYSKNLTLFSIFSILGVGIARIPYLLFKDDKSNEYYTSYQITFDMIKNNMSYYVKQHPDVFLIGVIGTIAVLIELVRNRKLLLQTEQYNVIITKIGILITSWAYFIGLLIWRWPLGYYLYVISALFSLVITVYLWKTFGNTRKALFFCLLISLIVSRFYSIPFSYYVATSQRAIDQVYTEAVNQYIHTAENRSRLLIEQWPFFVQPIKETNILIENIYDLDGFKVEGIFDIFDKSIFTPELMNLYRVEQIPSEEERMPKVGDYVLLFTGNKPSYWSLRSVTPFNSEESKLIQMGFDLDLVASNKITNHALFIDRTTKKIKLDETYLGYELYRVNNMTNYVIWNDRFADGWIGKNASCKITVNNPKEEMKFKIDAPDVVIPNKLRIINEDKLVQEIVITDSQSKYVSIKLPADSKTANLQFIVDKTFVPKQKGINEDTRELGIRIEKVN